VLAESTPSACSFSPTSTSDELIVIEMFVVVLLFHRAAVTPSEDTGITITATKTIAMMATIPNLFPICRFRS